MLKGEAPHIGRKHRGKVDLAAGGLLQGGLVLEEGAVVGVRVQRFDQHCSRGAAGRKSVKGRDTLDLELHGGLATAPLPAAVRVRARRRRPPPGATRKW